MSQVKQILRMHLQGQGIKTIARALSISKNTVKGYIGKAEHSNMPIADLLELEDPALETNYGQGTLRIKTNALST